MKRKARTGLRTSDGSPSNKKTEGRSEKETTLHPTKTPTKEKEGQKTEKCSHKDRERGRSIKTNSVGEAVKEGAKQSEETWVGCYKIK